MRTVQQISSSQITRIHIAKQQIGMADQQYRDTLSSFVDQSGQSCSSSKQLNSEQADVLLGIFKKLGFKEKHSGKQKKYEEYSSRDSKYATPAQMRKIDGLWFTSPNVKEKSEKSLNNFINHVARVNHISFLLKKDVSKVINAITHLKSREV